MIAQFVFLLAVVIAIGLGLAVLWSVLGSQPTPPAERVTVPIEDAREHLPR